MARITELTTTTPVVTDSIPYLDVSDTTQSASGSMNRLTISALLTLVTRTLSVLFAVGQGTGTFTWSNQPSAQTELGGLTRNRVRLDTTVYDEVRIAANVITAGESGATLALQYTTDTSGATGWTAITNASVSIGATGYVYSAFVALPAGANADVLYRVVGAGGNGSTSPAFASIRAEFRIAP